MAMMLSRMVAFICHGVWSQNATLLDDSLISPSTHGTSPRIAFSNVDLPQPEGPTIIVKLPREMVIVKLFSTGSFSTFQAKVAFLTVSAS
jgi:hypothetical protein